MTQKCITRKGRTREPDKERWVFRGQAVARRVGPGLVAAGLLLAGTTGSRLAAERPGRETGVQTGGGANALAEPPRSWALEASKNEIPVIEHRGLYLRYQMHVIDEKGDQLRDVVESRDGTVARLIERDGRPLTAEEDHAEQQRLNDLADSPAAYQKHINSDLTGKKRAAELILMLPDAMLFHYTPGQPQLESARGEQVVLDFAPNPDWRPPTLASEALTGLRGRVWIDVKTRHMVRMEGDIFESVNLGWGMLARIYPGGKLALDQTQATADRWIFAKFSEQLTVRALMVKTIRQNANISSAGYKTVAAMPYQEAIRMLLATPLPK